MKTFKKLGFDLSYLALLTKEDIKPLSRWEGSINHKKIKTLQNLGLRTKLVERRLLNGSTTSELIFSKSNNYLYFYTNRFDKTPIRKDYKTTITEGFLFGYPGCCVKNFAENGYTKNDYSRSGQEILFHWVCPGCEITPSLLPYYEKIYNDCKDIFTDQGINRPGLLKTLLPAATLSMLFSVLPTNIKGENPHWLPIVGNDPDHNYLIYSEEILLGVHENYFPPDSFAGPAKALEFKAIIDSLPIVDNDVGDAPNSSCYIIEHKQRGVVACPVCGEYINMGYIDIFNPMRELSISIPYLGLHFLENGSFSYGDTANYIRIDIELLKKIFAHYNSTHFSITTSNDADNDGLNDDYEDDFCTQINNPDSNENQLVDGAEVAEALINTIAGLPVIEYNEEPLSDSLYIEFGLMDGIETCDICGISMNMGDAHIVNPTKDTEIRFPIIGLHYLAHGRFAYGGSTNSGEIDALQLAQVLENQTVVSVLEKLPDKKNFSLKNYPNPFNPVTAIEFRLPRQSDIRIDIYNINGAFVENLYNGNSNAGIYTTQWNASRYPSGIYFVKLNSGDLQLTNKLLLLK
jgi:hypothetical protein